MKHSNDTIGNRTRDLPAYSAVPQPTVLPRAPFYPKDGVLNFLQKVVTYLLNYMVLHPRS